MYRMAFYYIGAMSDQMAELLEVIAQAHELYHHSI